MQSENFFTRRMPLTFVRISIFLCSLVALAEPLTVPQICKTRNFGYRIQDPEDCHSFYVCLGKWGEYKLNCGLDKRFNETLQKCIIGKCPPCACRMTSGDNTDEKDSFMPSLPPFLLPNNMQQALMDQSKDDLKASITALNISSTNPIALEASSNPKRIDGVAIQKVSGKGHTLAKAFNITNSFLNSSKLLKAEVNKSTKTLQGRVTNYEDLNFPIEYPRILESFIDSTTLSPIEQTTTISTISESPAENIGDLKTEPNSESSQIYNESSYIAIESPTPAETTKSNEETTAETFSELPTEHTTMLSEEPTQQSMIVAQNTVDTITDTTTDQPNEFITQTPLETATQPITVKGSFGEPSAEAFIETPTTKNNKATKTLFGRATNIDDINLPIEYSIRILEPFTDSTTLSQIELTTAISTTTDQTTKQFVGAIDVVFAKESSEIYDGASYISTESAIPTETTKSHEETTTDMTSELPTEHTTLLSEESSVQLLINTQNMVEAILSTSSNLANESTTQSPLETSTQALTPGEAFTEIPATKTNKNAKALLNRATNFEVTNMQVGHLSILDPYIDTTTFAGVEFTTTTSELPSETTTHTPKDLNTDPTTTAHLASELKTKSTIQPPVESMIESESTLKPTIELTELPTARELPIKSTTIFTEESTAQTANSGTAQITLSPLETATDTTTLSARPTAPTESTTQSSEEMATTPAPTTIQHINKTTDVTIETAATSSTELPKDTTTSKLEPTESATVPSTDYITTTEPTTQISDDSTTQGASTYLPTSTPELTTEATTSALTRDTTPETTKTSTVGTTETTVVKTTEKITASPTTAGNTPEGTVEPTHALTTESAVTTTESNQDTTLTELSSVPLTTTTMFTTESAATATESIQPTTAPITTTLHTTQSSATTLEPMHPTTTAPNTAFPTTTTLYTTDSAATTNESIEPTESATVPSTDDITTTETTTQISDDSTTQRASTYLPTSTPELTTEATTSALTRDTTPETTKTSTVGTTETTVVKTTEKITAAPTTAGNTPEGTVETTHALTTESAVTTTESNQDTTITELSSVPLTTTTMFTTESAATATESIQPTTAPITTTLHTTQSSTTTLEPMHPTTTVFPTTTILYTTDSAATTSESIEPTESATVPSTDYITTTSCRTESAASTTSVPLTTTILSTTESTTTIPCKASTTTSTTTCNTTTVSTTTSCKASTTTAATTCKPPTLNTTTAYKTETSTTTATTSCRTSTTTTTLSTTTTTTACKISTVTTTINSYSSIPCNKQQTTPTTNNIANNRNNEETSVNSICAKHDDGVYFIKHSKHCNKYYSCYQHQAYPQVCPGHFYFDEKLQMCNYPDAVDCKMESASKIHLEQPKPDDCRTLKSGTFIRDCKNCNKYYVCLNGRAVALYCPRGQYFDNESYVCNFKALVKNCAI